MNRILNMSNKVFAGISCLLALVVAMVAFLVASELGMSEVRRSAKAEAKTVIAITSGFVATYSELQSKLEKDLLPNPAIFRAMALHRVDQAILEGGNSTSVIGLPGREISKSATDAQMLAQIKILQKDPSIGDLESIRKTDDQTSHRTLVPFFALEPACADCHNRLQNLTGNDRWKVGDLMGAQYVDQNIDPQLAKSNRTAMVIFILIFLTMLASSYCVLFLIRQFHFGKKLQVLATTDSMTGCINRREMYERINGLGERTSGALLMLDLDRFKSINDTHGHAVGDKIIKDFSSRLKSGLRSSDWVARIGGEEFVVWMPNAKANTALLVAERLRKEIESSAVEISNVKINYTVSIGMHVVVNDPPSRFDAWLKAADEQLYRAKNAGRNTIEFQKGLLA